MCLRVGWKIGPLGLAVALVYQGLLLVLALFRIKYTPELTLANSVKTP